MIFRRPDAGFADDFAAADGAAGLSAGGEAVDELLATETFGAAASVADANGTSTLVNVLCGSKLSATCVGTTPLRAYTLTESSMLWTQVASQSMKADGA